MKTLVNGVTIAYDDRGSGFPLVFLHAFPMDRTMWLEQAAALSVRFRVITIDLRGHGESDAPYWRYGLDQYADDVQAVLAHLQIHSALFIGLSMGGYVEFELYRRHPRSIRGLILADTRAEGDRPEQIRWRFELAQRAAASGADVVASEMLPKLLSPGTYEHNPGLVEEVRAIMRSAPIPGIIGDLMALAGRADSTELLPAIAVPTLVVVGEDDRLTPPDDAALMAEAIPGARMIMIPGAGHLSNMEQPVLFNRAVEEFAAAVAARHI